MGAVPVSEPLRDGHLESTDLEGWFELTGIPRRATELMVEVAAIGFGYRLCRITVQPERPIILNVSDVTGTLIIQPLGGLHRGNPFFQKPILYLVHNNSVAGLPQIERWAVLNGGGVTGEAMVVPQMEPGHYRLCTALITEFPLLVSGAFPPNRCVDGELLPGQELIIAPPASGIPSNKSRR